MNGQSLFMYLMDECFLCLIYLLLVMLTNFFREFV